MSDQQEKHPAPDCDLCPRLYEFRVQNKDKFPDKFNAPVPPFGPATARLAIIGLAPGLRGANFTGRPFTGDYAGLLLYSTLRSYNFASGTYGARPDDGLKLHDCRIINAVRCVPPENKPTGAEITQCRPFLISALQNMPNLKVLLTLGRIAHDSTLRTYGQKPAAHKFAHNARHDLPGGPVLINSYHCSRYNTQTGRLTEKMFHDVFDHIRAIIPE